jgi:hypothetical protein
MTMNISEAQQILLETSEIQCSSLYIRYKSALSIKPRISDENRRRTLVATYRMAGELTEQCSRHFRWNENLPLTQNVQDEPV